VEGAKPGSIKLRLPWLTTTGLTPSAFITARPQRTVTVVEPSDKISTRTCESASTLIEATGDSNWMVPTLFAVR
jgi:hypothetical protein